MRVHHDSERFIGATDFLDIDRLERETRRLLFLGFFVAVMFHAALGSYFMFKETEVRVMKPLTMELVVRRPRMIKPFEFRKPRIEKRVYRKHAYTAPSIPKIDVARKALPEYSIGKIPAFTGTDKMNIEAEETFYIPDDIRINLDIKRIPSRQISMKEELITIDDLDTGKYKGLVIRDPNNKQNIRGFIYIATLWGTDLEPEFKRGIIHLSDAVNRYTLIQSKVDEHLFLDKPDLFKFPFVYLSVTEQFELTVREAVNFGKYLKSGGFAVIENGIPQRETSYAKASLRQMIRDSLGKDAVFLPIPNTHPLYHCFFDFEGPPLSAENDPDPYERTWFNSDGTSGSMTAYKTDQKPVFFLEGIWIKNRLVVIYSDKGYGRDWEKDAENDPQLKMGVNMVVFALIQDGGIAERLMEQYTEKQ